jgi:hypothetical protein
LQLLACAVSKLFCLSCALQAESTFQLLQVQRCTKYDIAFDQFSSFFELRLQLVITNCLGGYCTLTNQLFEPPQSPNCCTFESSSHLLNSGKFGSFTPSINGFHPAHVTVTMNNKTKKTASPLMRCSKNTLLLNMILTCQGSIYSQTRAHQGQWRKEFPYEPPCERFLVASKMVSVNMVSGLL